MRTIMKSETSRCQESWTLASGLEMSLKVHEQNRGLIGGFPLGLEDSFLKLRLLSSKSKS